MKILIAQMEHETNTFSPVPTPWESFGPNGAYLGRDAYRAMKGTRTPIGAFIDLAEKVKAEIVTPVAGFAYPSGPVDGAAYDRFCDLICNEAAKGCDAIFLDLHGAMVVKDRTMDGSRADETGPGDAARPAAGTEGPLQSPAGRFEQAAADSR